MALCFLHPCFLEVGMFWGVLCLHLLRSSGDILEGENGTDGGEIGFCSFSKM